MRTLGLSKVNLAVLQERIRQARRDLAELRAMEHLARKVQREAGQRGGADADCK